MARCFARAAARILAPVFRGGIEDYARSIELGAGYVLPDGHVCRSCSAAGLLQCRHFEIDTCRQLVGPFAALADDNVRTVMVLKAVQTLGSITWDMTLHYMLVHTQFKKIKVFIDSIEKATRYCDDRLMPTLTANPDISPMLPSGPDRHDATKTAIYFANGKSIEILPLNESSASSLTADAVVIDEGWEHGSDGLMQKAIDRAKQVSYRKIFIVGQAGNKDEDQDRIWRGLHKRVPVTFACPCCGGRQEFNLTRARPEDFVPRVVGQRFQPVLPDVIELQDGSNRTGKMHCPTTPQYELPFPIEAPKPGTFWGLKVARRFSEIENEEEIKAVAATTVFECYHCGFEIPDTKAMRRAMMATYEQDYQVNGRTPPDFTVGFWNPDPASVTIPFSQTMYEYIVAKLTHDKLGNRKPLEDFYKNRWATAWNEDISAKSPERPSASLYDVTEKIPGEKCRISATDIQFKLTHMVYLAVAVGDGVPPRLLHYEWIKPPTGLTDQAAGEFCKNRVRALDKEFGIQQQNSMKDAAHEPGLIREWAAEDAVWAKMLKGNRISWGWAAYGLLMGDDRMSYLWKHPGRKDTWERFKQFHWHKVDAIKAGQRVKVDVHHRLWSNPSIKEIAERWRDGSGAPKLEIHEQWLKDTSKEGLWSQLNAERKIPWKGHPGKLHYNNEGRPNHAFDCWCMIVVRMDELGYLNSFGPPPAEEES